MDNNIRIILAHLQAKSEDWDNIQDHIYHVCQHHSHSICTILLAFMENYKETLAHLYLNVLVNFMPLDDFPQVIQQALVHISANKPNFGNPERHDVAEAILYIIALEAPQQLHPYLQALFDLDINNHATYGAYPWRESGQLHYDFLAGLLQDYHQSKSCQGRAAQALLESRHPQALLVVRKWIKKVDPSLFHEVGYEEKNGQLIPLYHENPLHLVFPDAYWLSREVPHHYNYYQFVPPSFPLAIRENTTSQHFGGTLNLPCPRCQATLGHIITLNPIPKGLGITGLHQLTLGFCLNCVGMGINVKELLFYRHNEIGAIISIGFLGTPTSLIYSFSPLQETKVYLVDAGPRWKWNSRTYLHRIGGHPTWIQDASYPNCPVCQQTMRFILQLDSGLLDSNGQERMWDDTGMVYAFWCNECKISYWDEHSC